VSVLRKSSNTIQCQTWWYWERFIVIFHSQFSTIITITSADRAECGLLNTEIHIFKEIFKIFRYSETWLLLLPIADHQIFNRCWETIIPWRSFVLQINCCGNIKKFQNSLQFIMCKPPLRFKPQLFLPSLWYCSVRQSAG